MISRSIGTSPTGSLARSLTLLLLLPAKTEGMYKYTVARIQEATVGNYREKMSGRCNSRSDSRSVNPGPCHHLPTPLRAPSLLPDQIVSPRFFLPGQSTVKWKYISFIGTSWNEYPKYHTVKVALSRHSVWARRVLGAGTLRARLVASVNRAVIALFSFAILFAEEALRCEHDEGLAASPASVGVFGRSRADQELCQCWSENILALMLRS